MEKKKTKRGRKPKLSIELIEEICGYLEEGLYDKDAYELAGVSHTAFYKWMQEGETARSGLKKELVESVTRARLEGKRVQIKKVTGAQDWRAAIAYLERKYPNEWGKIDRVDVTTQNRPIGGFSLIVKDGSEKPAGDE